MNKTLSCAVVAVVCGVASAQPKSDAAAPKAEPKPVSPERQQAIDTAKAAGVLGKKPDAAAKPVDTTPGKPPADIAAFAKLFTGTSKCTGQATDPTNTQVPMKATIKTKTDLDGWWIHESYDGTMGKSKFKMVAYTTYDAASKKWRRIAVDNMGMQMVGTSDGVKDNKVVFNLDAVGGGMTIQFKDTLDVSDPKNIKSWGEMSMDKGKSWAKVYETACKR